MKHALSGQVSPMRALPVALLLLGALAACTDRAPGLAKDAAIAAGTDAAIVEQATATAARPGIEVAPAAATVAGAPVDAPISFAGFGPARFGADAQAVRTAWGRDIPPAAPSEPGGCHYLYPQPRTSPGAPGGYGTGFMIEGDRFARIDIDSADIVAPGGGRVGMHADQIGSLYAGRIEARPHKYVEGAQTLRIRDPAGGNGALLFETDAAGKVERWRIGVPPQVDYVEGCA